MSSAALPVAVWMAPAPHRRGRDALGTAGKLALSAVEGMPALPETAHQEKKKIVRP